jgi:hypothetical protein
LQMLLNEGDAKGWTVVHIGIRESSHSVVWETTSAVF